jgi:hypothetical protein
MQPKNNKKRSIEMNTKNNRNNHTNTVYSTFAVLSYINRQKIKKSGMCPLMGRVSINAEVLQISSPKSKNSPYFTKRNYINQLNK